MAAPDPGTEGLAAYAAARGLELVEGARLPRRTPLLAEGELRSVDAVASGWLATYVEATLAVVTRDGGRFTVAVTHVPKAKRFVPWLLCHRTEDEHLLGRAFEGLVHGADRVDLGSAELDAHYRIYADRERDDVWLHELFSPAFVVYLIERAPTGFAFEYVEGTLCVSLLGSRTLAEDLDGLRDATVELVGKLRAEIRERLGEAKGRSAPTPPGYPEPEP
ncbi:MAG: hypothetical protein JST31_07850 [Actinobacteria bacterium]|nr:hypothetical protein [Actinomycetota bacterium]